MQYLKYLFLFFATMVVAQEKPQKQERPESPYADDVRDLIIDGNDYLEDNAFAKAEASYREAVALDPTNVAAKYNSGNNYYENEKWEESTAGLLKATAIAQTKKEKHKAFHNLGNALYQQKDFKAAVEAYKNALRNNPTDEETRYNLALAKEEEEQNGGGGGTEKKKRQKMKVKKRKTKVNRKKTKMANLKTKIRNNLEIRESKKKHLLHNPEKVNYLLNK